MCATLPHAIQCRAPWTLGNTSSHRSIREKESEVWFLTHHFMLSEQSKISPPPSVLTPIPLSSLSREQKVPMLHISERFTFTHTPTTRSTFSSQTSKIQRTFFFWPKICSVLPDGHKDCRLLTPQSHLKEHDIWMSLHLFRTELDILVICPSCQWLTSLFCSPMDVILCRQKFWSFSARTRAITAIGKTKVTP